MKSNDEEKNVESIKGLAGVIHKCSSQIKLPAKELEIKIFSYESLKQFIDFQKCQHPNYKLK